MAGRDDGDIYAAGGAEGGAAKDYGGYSYDAPNPFANLGQVDPSTMAPMFGGAAPGAMAGAQIQPQYLHYQPKTAVERMFYNTGSAYLIGIGVGGTYGAVHGLRNAPARSRKLKLRVNALMNGSGRFGSRFGNALGAVAMMYSCFEAGADQLRIEEYVGGDDFVNPVLAAVATGLLYKSTQGPKTMALAGVIGGTVVAGLAGARLFMAGSGSGRAGALFF